MALMNVFAFSNLYHWNIDSFLRNILSSYDKCNIVYT